MSSSRPPTPSRPRHPRTPAVRRARCAGVADFRGLPAPPRPRPPRPRSSGSPRTAENPTERTQPAAARRPAGFPRKEVAMISTRCALWLRSAAAALGLLLATALTSNGEPGGCGCDAPRCLEQLEGLSACRLGELFTRAELGHPLV